MLNLVLLPQNYFGSEHTTNDKYINIIHKRLGIKRTYTVHLTFRTRDYWESEMKYNSEYEQRVDDARIVTQKKSFRLSYSQ